MVGRCDRPSNLLADVRRTDETGKTRDRSFRNFEKLFKDSFKVLKHLANTGRKEEALGVGCAQNQMRLPICSKNAQVKVSLRRRQIHRINSQPVEWRPIDTAGFQIKGDVRFRYSVWFTCLYTFMR